MKSRKLSTATTSQTMSRSTRPDWRRSCCNCSQSTRLWSCRKNPFSHFWQTKDFKPPDLDKDTHGCYCRASPHGGVFATTLKQFPPSLYWLGLQWHSCMPKENNWLFWNLQQQQRFLRFLSHKYLYLQVICTSLKYQRFPIETRLRMP